jgi:hypothetical protein
MEDVMSVEAIGQNEFAELRVNAISEPLVIS